MNGKPRHSDYQKKHPSDTEESGASTEEEEHDPSERLQAYKFQDVQLPKGSVCVKEKQLSDLYKKVSVLSAEVQKMLRVTGVPIPPAGNEPIIKDPKPGVLVCTVCFTKFGTESRLKKHMDIHKGVKGAGHQCKKCRKVFHKKKSLTRHIPVCGKKYTCEFLLDPNDEKSKCGREFDQPSNLAKHKLVHQPPRKVLDVKCKWCNKHNFTSMASYHEHVPHCPKNTSETKVPQCFCTFDGCPRQKKGFNRYKELTSHLIKIHNWNPKHLKGRKELPKPPPKPKAASSKPKSPKKGSKKDDGNNGKPKQVARKSTGGKPTATKASKD